MEKQFAKMHGNICLEKTPSQNWTNRGTPTVYGIFEVQNGHRIFQGKPQNGGCETLPAAIEQLYDLFQLEMEERGYELRIEGEPYYLPLNDGTDNFSYLPYQGESGWYDLNNNCMVDTVEPKNNKANYPLSDYPATPAEWVAKGITSYAYDNYRVTIVTSNWKEVQL